MAPAPVHASPPQTMVPASTSAQVARVPPPTHTHDLCVHKHEVHAPRVHGHLQRGHVEAQVGGYGEVHGDGGGGAGGNVAQGPPACVTQAARTCVCVCV